MVRILWSWLQELVDISETPEAFAERLTRAGLEVEAITPYRRLPAFLSQIQIGQVLTLERHPAADRLWIAQVTLGTGEPLTIVTGANNLQVGARVPVALPGTVIPGAQGSIAIEPRTFRGIRSEGMLCSQKELQLGSDAEGIWILPESAPLGEPLTTLLEDYTDTVLEFSATPNRGDALSHWGIAREYHVLTGASLHLPQFTPLKEEAPFPFELIVPEPSFVPRYGGLYLESKGDWASPGWLSLRLEAAGMRSIHPIVDVTNYLLIGFGQPLHAFDVDQLASSRLVIGPLSKPAAFQTLTGQTIDLLPGDVVIADEEGPACLGGILGGLRSAVSPSTRRVFLESAYFAPRPIRRTARRLGLNTESAYRFMRGTNPDLVPWAARYAAALLAQHTPSLITSAFIEVHDETYTAPRRLTFSLPKLRALTALPLPPNEVEAILTRLDITLIEKTPDETYTAASPCYRLDVTSAVDIAEELVRVYGWEAVPIPTATPALPYKPPSPTARQAALIHRLSEFLTGLGLWEIRTNSLTAKARLAPNLEAIRLANPLYEEVAYLRTTLANGLDVVLYNRNHGASGFWAYEWGKVYLPSSEVLKLALWGWGRPPRHHLQKGPFWESFLALIESLFTRLGLPYRVEAFYTPTGALWLEGVRFYSDGQLLGTAGLLHPDYLAGTDLAGELVAYAEFEASRLLSAPPRQLPSFRGFSLYPLVVKDLSFYLPKGLTYAAIQEALQKSPKLQPYLQWIEPFDRYYDPSHGLSYGIRLYLQATDRTLDEATIHALLDEAMRLIEKLGATIRKKA